MDDGYFEGLIRGFRSGILKRSDYMNLCQCETLEGESDLVVVVVVVVAVDAVDAVVVVVVSVLVLVLVLVLMQTRGHTSPANPSLPCTPSSGVRERASCEWHRISDLLCGWTSAE